MENVFGGVNMKYRRRILSAYESVVVLYKKFDEEWIDGSTVIVREEIDIH